MAFSDFQQSLIEGLQKARDPDITEIRSKIIAAAATRELARPLDAFVDALKHYPGLSNLERVKKDVEFLRHQGVWLSSSTSYGETLVHAAKDIEDQIQKITGGAIMASAVIDERKLHLPNIEVIGPMTSQSAFTGFLARLENATKEICLPMLATSTNLGFASILAERARNGVSVKILLASPDAAEKLRGPASAALAKEAINGWREWARRGGRDFKIRIALTPEDLLMASCACIDGKFLRLDIYDHQKQKSLEGQLIEAHAERDGYRLNIIGLFEDWFNQVWSRSRPSEIGDLIGWGITNYWHYWTGILGLFISLIVGVTSDFGTVAASIGGSLLVAGLVESAPRIKSRIASLFGFFTPRR